MENLISAMSVSVGKVLETAPSAGKLLGSVLPGALTLMPKLLPTVTGMVPMISSLLANEKVVDGLTLIMKGMTKAVLGIAKL